MSAPTWLNQATAHSNGDNASQNPVGPTAIPYSRPPAAASIDPGQLQYQQMQQIRMQNGNTHHNPPTSQSPMYNTQNIIPSKRSRPREGSIGALSQSHPSGPPVPPSQAPQGTYQGLQGAVHGGSQFGVSAPYQQYQQQNNNLKQPAVMQPQSFSSQEPSHGLHRPSPSPFSPASQVFGAQNNTPLPDPTSRIETGPKNGQNYQPHGANQARSQLTNIGADHMPTSHVTNSQKLNSQQHGVYVASNARQMPDVQSHAQIQGNNILQRQPNPPTTPLGHAVGHPVDKNGNHLTTQMQQRVHPQANNIPANRIQDHEIQTQARPNNLDRLMRIMIQYMHSQKRPFDPRPIIAGNSVSCVRIFILGMKLGGSRKVQRRAQWPQIAQSISVAQSEIVVAGQEIHVYWDQNLAQWERYFTQQQQSKSKRQRHRKIHSNDTLAKMILRGTFGKKHPKNISEKRDTEANFPKTGVLAKNVASQMIAKRKFPNVVTRETFMIGTRGATSSRMDLPAPHPIANFYIPRIGADASPKRRRGRRDSQERSPDPRAIGNSEKEPNSPQERAQYHGGLPVSNLFFKDTLDVLTKYKHSTPQLNELGVIDIQALVLSMKSGIHGEVRLALDVIAALSRVKPPPLRECEELLDTLVDFARDQIEILAKSLCKSSDNSQLLSNQEQIRGFAMQSYILQEVPEIGSRRYDLARAASLLVGVVTILRNLSLRPDNSECLREPSVIRMMTTVVRFLGTRDLFLRTHQNALDFSKDMVIFLSALSPFLDLTGKEEGLAILQFLLSFAPEPRPKTQSEKISFEFYVPTKHRYLPHAVNALAKLIARDPNRALYRSIFASESLSSPPFPLLTRAFGLAISVIPEAAHHQGRGHGVIAVRSPIIAQGLLAAEILVGMLPVSAHDTAYSWLACQDGLLSRLMALLSLIQKPPSTELRRRRDGRLGTASKLHIGYRMINARGLALLRKLEERARDAPAFATDFSPDVFRLKQGTIRAPSSTTEPLG